MLYAKMTVAQVSPQGCVAVLLESIQTSLSSMRTVYHLLRDLQEDHSCTLYHAQDTNLTLNSTDEDHGYLAVANSSMSSVYYT